MTESEKTEDAPEKKDAPVPSGGERKPPDDSFLSALVFMTGFFGHARSPDALQAGLPIKKEGMTPKLFCTAADRAGFKARIVRRGIAKIPNEVLPVVAVLKTKQAVVILQKNDKKLHILDPVTRKEREATIKEFSKEYAGYALYARPDYLDEEDKGNEPLSRHWFWSIVLDNRSLYFKVIAATLIVNMFALTSSIYIMNFYNRVLPNNAVETGWVLSIGAGSVYLFDFLMRTLRGYFTDVASRRADVILGQKLYDQVLDMRFGHQPGSTGVFANSMREFDALREFFNSATVTGLVDFPFSVIFLAAIWVIAGLKMTLALGFLFIAVMIVGYILQLPVRRKVHQAMKTAELKHGLLVETISSLETVRGVGGEGALRDSYGHYTGRAAEASQASRFWSGLSVNFSVLVQMMSGIVIVLLGMYMINDNELTMGALIACVILSSRAIAPIGQVASLVSRWHHARSAYRTLNQIMRLPVERPREQKFLHRPKLKGQFTFRNVSFTYPRTHRPVLQEVNLNIKAGEKVAIIGKIGSGKSTLIKLLVNFYLPTEGTVLVDDTDMRQLDPADLRRNVAYMGQDTALMSGSIRENIVMGRPRAPDEMVMRVAELTGVHDFVRHHPMGYDAPVGERGWELSGGQRQAVALARTLLMNAPVVVMDEPTNSMDSSTEAKVLKSLGLYIQDKTFVLVTHKFPLLQLVSRVIVMDNSRIVMDGPKDEVIAALSKNMKQKGSAS